LWQKRGEGNGKNTGRRNWGGKQANEKAKAGSVGKGQDTSREKQSKKERKGGVL